MPAPIVPAALVATDAAAKIIASLLKAQPLVRQAVGDRVYPDMIPRDKDGNLPASNIPAIIYQFQAGDNLTIVGGETVWLDSTWIIKAVGTESYPALSGAVRGMELAFAPNEAVYLVMDGFYVSVVKEGEIRLPDFDNNVRYYHSGAVYRFIVSRLEG